MVMKQSFAKRNYQTVDIDRADGQLNSVFVLMSHYYDLLWLEVKDDIEQMV